MGLTILLYSRAHEMKMRSGIGKFVPNRMLRDLAAVEDSLSLDTVSVEVFDIDLNFVKTGPV